MQMQKIVMLIFCGQIKLSGFKQNKKRRQQKMTVLQVLENASLYLDLLDEFEPFFNSGSETEIGSETQKEFDKLLYALNLVVVEIISEYAEVITEEEIEFKNNCFEITKLSKALNRVYNIVKNKNNVEYKIFGDKIKADTEGNATIVYSYYPDKLQSLDNLGFLNSKVSLKTLALGVASEYCFINGFFDDAKVWEERFEKSLQGNLKKLGKVNLPNRRWL